MIEVGDKVSFEDGDKRKREGFVKAVGPEPWHDPKATYVRIMCPGDGIAYILEPSKVTFVAKPEPPETEEPATTEGAAPTDGIDADDEGDK